MTTQLDRRRTQARRLLILRRIGSLVLGAFAALVLAVGLPLLVWKGPYLLDDNIKEPAGPRRNSAAPIDGASAALISGLRAALVAAVAAIGTGAAVAYTARTYRLARRGQVTDRFAEALERLGSSEMYVRIGGVLALEMIVVDEPNHATHAAQVLGQFVRDRAPARRESSLRRGSSTLRESPDTDIQAALLALTRFESRTYVDGREILNLERLHLCGADLRGADLTKANLSGANLAHADLRRAVLTEADLKDAILTEAKLHEANVVSADLRRADLTGTKFLHADLTDAKLGGATFDATNLGWADLTDARMAGAHGVILFHEADLTRTNLNFADLRKAHGLSAAKIKLARFNEDTKLPPDIKTALRPPAD
ncbi:pentapeptide repeat-containing protein [Streptomyces yangpuensis]|uniref:pentapeptide repeat-containing protein n=1 Tax=Streptomyces yangpuensis TaxID=1648182 RepID=UPI0036272C0A